MVDKTPALEKQALAEYGHKNPWADATWNLTAQGVFLKKYGIDIAREYAASAGTTVGGQRPKPKVKAGKPGGAGGRGRSGNDGDPGYSPIFALISDGERRVVQIVDWQQGAPPDDAYVGALGLVTDIVDAVDIRGPAGSGSGGSGAPFMEFQNKTPVDDEIILGRFTTDDVLLFLEEVTGTGESLVLSYSSDGFSYTPWGEIAVGSAWSPIDGVIHVRGLISGYMWLSSSLEASLDDNPSIHPGGRVGSARPAMQVIAFKITAPDGTIASGNVRVLTPGGEGDALETFYRLTENGDRRITENGDARILELAS